MFLSLIAVSFSFSFSVCGQCVCQFLETLGWAWGMHPATLGVVPAAPTGCGSLTTTSSHGASHLTPSGCAVPGEGAVRVMRVGHWLERRGPCVLLDAS